jgi:hypothetical protein
LLPQPGFEHYVRVEGICTVCHYYSTTAAAFKHLIASKDGVVSFEYVIVAAAIVGAVVLAFGAAGGTGPINDTLTSALNTMVSRFSTAVGG